MRRQHGARAVVAGAITGLAALAGTAGQYFEPPAAAERGPWGAAALPAGEAAERAAAGECSRESWATIIEERLGARLANGLYNASVRSLWGPLGYDRGDVRARSDTRCSRGGTDRRRLLPTFLFGRPRGGI